jgi:acyl-coenzyme A synthetase/AMP-(fatty) acid ligase
MTGYWGDSAATDAVLVTDPLEPRSGQRLLRTGDLAFRDSDGALRFCGRRDSQVQIRGNRVEPAEVQRRLLAHPEVSEAAVVVHEGPDGNAELSAFVVPADGTARTAESDLLAFCLRSMPSYMAPSVVRIVGSLPVNQHGKTDHRQLLAQLVTDAA